MREILRLFKDKRKYYEEKVKKSFLGHRIITHKKKNVIMYPAGKKTESLVQSLRKNKIRIIAAGDRDAKMWGKRIGRIEILPPVELAQKYSKLPVIMTSTYYRNEITAFLKKMGFRSIYPISFLNFIDPDIYIVYPGYATRFDVLFDLTNQAHILELSDLWGDGESRKIFLRILKFYLSFDSRQLRYKRFSQQAGFDKKLLSFSKEEVFIDCGAYTGDTVERFMSAVSGKFKKVYAFEPDKNNFEQLSKKYKQIGKTKVCCILRGVYNFTGKARFVETGDPAARIIDDKRSTLVNVSSIDDFMKDKEPPTFIKMDIEGSETEALLGAKTTIEKYRPKLAVSVYHNATDLWRIPLLIKKLNNAYKIYLRHYSDEIMDTICYAL